VTRRPHTTVEVWEPGVGWVKRPVHRMQRRRAGARERARGGDPHESPASWPGVGYSAREFAEGARGVFAPNPLRRVLVEVSELAEACAKGALAAVDVANRLGGSLGGFGAAFALLVALDHNKRKRRGRR